MNEAIYVFDQNGNSLGALSESPYTYRGYYFDAETGLYYLNARYYDPEVGRFTQEDTYQEDNLEYNFYGYCSANPVLYQDNNGNSIKVNRADHTLYGYVAKITDDNLYMNGHTGNVTIRKRNNNYKRIYGTNLIRNLIMNKYNVTIYKITSGASHSVPNTLKNANHPQDKKNMYKWGKGSGGKVYLRYQDATKNDPLFIILAHELIHVYRYMKGVRVPDNIRSNAHKCKMEEALTVGLINSRSYSYYQVGYTENLIRKENKYKLRTSY